MKVEILYVTFNRDLEWLKFSLRSILKYARGFSGVTIVVPTYDLDLFLQFEKWSTPGLKIVVKNFLEYPGKGFVHHLAMKCYADVFCPNADLVLHMDPDCLFHGPVSPDDYIVDGKPVLVVEPYEVVKLYHEPRYYWRRITEEALKFDCKYETMCRHPAVHYKWLYPQMRSFMERVHTTPFLDFVLKQKNSFPQGFGEFNTLGSFAEAYFGGSDYHIHDCGPMRLARIDEVREKPEAGIGHPPPRLTQLWSHSGVSNPKNQEVIKRILG